MEKNKSDARLITPPLLQEQERQDWSEIKQNAMINALALVRTAEGRNTELEEDIDGETGELYTRLVTQTRQITVEHKGGALEWNHGLQRVLHFLNVLHTRADNKPDTVAFTAREYADHYKLTNYTRAHNEVKEALLTLKDSDIRVESGKDWGVFSILADVAYGSRRGEYYATLSQTMHRSLRNGQPMYTLLRAWQIDPKRYPHAQTLYDLFSKHQRRNLHREAGIRPLLSVPYLLENCYNLPTLEELKEKKSRDYKARIITPLERNMNKLVEDDVFISWRYCKTGGEALTAKEEEQTGNYDYFIKLNIEVELHEHPGLAAQRAKAIERQARLEEPADE